MIKLRISLVIVAVVNLLPIHSFAQWTISISNDEMTGKSSCYASSPATGPTKPMGFPYHDVTAWLGIGADGKREWVYVGFSESPTLTGTDIGDGYNTIRTRIKWDDKVENVTLVQEWGSKFLHFENDSKIIAKIASSNSVLLELNWYSEGRSYFKFSLAGSSAAISKLRNSCGKRK